MSFQDLPVEILRDIIQYISLDVTRLSPFSTVNVQFRNVIETHTFARLEVTSDDLSHLAVLLQSSPVRRAALQTLQLDVILPAYSSEARAFMENAADQASNDIYYSRAISSLFDILCQCDSETSRPLNIKIRPPNTKMDRWYRDHEQEEKDRDDRRQGRLRDLGVLRYKHSHLQLLNADCLPNIQRVRQFDIRGAGHRFIEPAIAVVLQSKFPNLESSQWYISDNERRYPETRFRLRQALAKALLCREVDQSEQMKSFIMSLEHRPPENHAFINTDVRGAVHDKLDDLSISLGDYLRFNNLVTVALDGPICVAPELLWRQDLSREQLSWPNLEIFSIALQSVCPDGTWYLERDPFADFDDHRQYDDDQGPEERAYDPEQVVPTVSGIEGDVYDRAAVEHLIGDLPSWKFRAWPAPGLVDFYKAVARAAALMPKIRKLITTMEVPESKRTDEVMSRIHTQATTRGNVARSCDTNTADLEYGRMLWEVPQHWQMDEELSRLWQLVLGTDMMVEYEHW